MDKKKHYLVYKTTNLVNGKIYIGQHQTYDLNDDYLGSGMLLQKAIEKYGRENFKREILFECSSKEEMDAKEAEIVNEEFLKRDDIYNLKQGGIGGWDYITEKRKSDDERKKWGESVSEGMKKAWSEHPETFKTSNMHLIDPMAFKGKHHTKETKEKFSIRMKTDANVMRHSIWIYNEITLEAKIHSKSKPIPEGWHRGQKPPVQIDESNPAHSRCWMNNGKESKFVLKSEKDIYIEQGWKVGRLTFTT